MDDLLAELNWSKAELARRLGIHRNTVYQWEKAPIYAMAYLQLQVDIRRALK